MTQKQNNTHRETDKDTGTHLCTTRNNTTDAWVRSTKLKGCSPKGHAMLFTDSLNLFDLLYNLGEPGSAIPGNVAKKKKKPAPQPFGERQSGQASPQLELCYT